jgi:Gas vesicle protein
MPIHHTPQTSNLLEVLEKILDKGVVIAGDIKISLADVDLLTIKIRLLVASVDKAREIGLNWWENDPYYSSKARIAEQEHALLQERINRLEQLVDQNKLLPQPEERVVIEGMGENSLPLEMDNTPLPLKKDESSSDQVMMEMKSQVKEMKAEKKNSPRKP